MKTTIRQARQRLTLSRGELARRAQVAPSTVWRVERGCHVPLMATRRALALALNLSPRAIAWPEEGVPYADLPF